MNRANQIALFQATNQGLLNIRQSELNYYINLNIAFGTQAALIGGFTYGVFTQNQDNEDESYANTFQQIYWVTSAATIAISIHVVITTMLIQVLGPGLALHGPVGSVASAAVGMRKEQETIIIAFILMMVLFSITTVLSFWAVFSRESAIGGTIVYIIAARYWYYYSERIYLRFYWDPKQEGGWDEAVDRDSFVDDLPNQTLQSGTNPIHGRNGKSTDASGDERMASVVSESRRPSGEKSSKSSKSRFRFLRIRTRKPSNPELSKKLLEGEHAGTLPKGAAPSAASMAAGRTVVMEGYLSRKSSDQIRDFKLNPWERMYAILNSAGGLYFYRSRQSYRDNPRETVYKRPVLLVDYWVEVYNSERERNVSMESDIASVATIESRVATGKERVPLFRITLRPKDNEGESARYPWVLRCDTEEELDSWMTAIIEVVPDSFQP